jgi:tetratricopeptide (TPR) repeat protein
MSKPVSRFATWVCAAAAALIAGCATTPTNAPAETADAAPPEVPRIFGPETGDIVVAASQKLSADEPDYLGALAHLEAAIARSDISSYELGVILFMRGGVKYQLEDTDGAVADWNRALAEGALNDAERLSITYNLGQLYLSEGEYRPAVERIEGWIDAGGVASDSVHLSLVAAYVELGDLRSALDHAREAYAVAEPRQRRHYDTLHYLYTELGMAAERDALLRDAEAAQIPIRSPN